jgi:hypothetical protein
MSMFRPEKFVILAWVLLWLPMLAHAEMEPEVEAQAERETYLGESLQYQVVIRNVDGPPAPDLSALDADFNVAATGDAPRNQHMEIINNGRRSVHQEFCHIYAYKLTPKRAGQLSIPAPVVKIGGKSYAGPARSVRVIGPEKQDAVLMEIVTSKPRVYPTQSFDVTLRILVKPLPGSDTKDPVANLKSAPKLMVNWAETVPEGLKSNEVKEWLVPLLSQTGRGFSINSIVSQDSFRSIFDEAQAAVFSLYTGREKRPGADGIAINYFVYELTRKFSAEKRGSHTFGPASVKGVFVDGDAGRRVYAMAAPKTVEVRGVLTPRPGHFSGGIGAHQVAASAAPVTLRVGDPLTLILEVKRLSGAGSLDLVSAPDLSQLPAIADDFEIIDKAPVGQTSGDVKRFSYGLRPKHPGVGIPALTVSFFDPEQEKFTELSTLPIKLDVSKAAERKVGDVGLVPPVAASREIRNIEQGVFQNIEDLALIRDERVSPSAYIAAVLGMGAAFGALYFASVILRRRAGDSAWVRRQNAWREAQAHLEAARIALAAKRNADAVKALRSGVLGFIADMLNLPVAGMTAADAGRALATVENTVARQVFGLLQELEAAEYGSAAQGGIAELVADAEKLLPQLRRQLEGRR